MVARHDLTTDEWLRNDLLMVRHGTAYFARKVNELDDTEFDGPTLLPGWSRRHLIAHVGYNARALTRLVQWANTGVKSPMYQSPEEREAEIDFGATLPARALRHLADHAAISLDVEWRDTPDQAWGAKVCTAQGREVPARETVWMRTREVWIHAVDLDNGASFTDVPESVLHRLLSDITGTWAARGSSPGLVLEAEFEGGTVRFPAEAGLESAQSTGSEAPDNSHPGSAEAGLVVSGTLPSLVRWATGRSLVDVEKLSECQTDGRAGRLQADFYGASGMELRFSTGHPVSPPHWL